MATPRARWRDESSLERTPSNYEWIGENDPDDLPIFTFEEVKVHNKPWDCWMIIHGRVYDIKRILSTHPGGSQILLKYAGMDATYQFDDVGHSMESLLYDMPPGSLKGYIEVRKQQQKGKQEGRDNHFKREKSAGNFSYDNEDYSNQSDSIVMGRGQSLDGYLLWNKMYSYFLCLTILFCIFALLYMKVYQHIRSTSTVNAVFRRDPAFASSTSDQERVLDTDSIPDWAY